LALIVMKFGGSSVGDAERMKRAARRIADRRAEGHRVVAVVSAMGDTTDDLIDLSKAIAGRSPSPREMDMLLSTGEQVSIALLAMALHDLGEKAVSLTGWQAGIRTEKLHGKARIVEIRPERVLCALEDNAVAVVAGFQGITEDGEITTLGRGGSDTTAVALAAALRADLCEIYTDVDGVYSTDPRVVRCARQLKEISYDEMLELAHLGAAVLHPRAVECAKNHRVPLVVRSSFTNGEGTLVKEEVGLEQGMIVRGIAYEKQIARVTVWDVPERPGQLFRIFSALAAAAINVDIIVQSGVRGGVADVAFTVSEADLDSTLGVLERIKSEVGFREVTSEKGLAKVSIVGAGMASNPGVAARMFETIAGLGVSVNMVSTSEIKVSCVIDAEKTADVVRALHTAFGLDTTEEVFVGGPAERR